MFYGCQGPLPYSGALEFTPLSTIINDKRAWRRKLSTPGKEKEGKSVSQRKYIQGYSGMCNMYAWPISQGERPNAKTVVSD